MYEERIGGFALHRYGVELVLNQRYIEQCCPTVRKLQRSPVLLSFQTDRNLSGHPNACGACRYRYCFPTLRYMF
jgi:hypothetical protein